MDLLRLSTSKLSPDFFDKVVEKLLEQLEEDKVGDDSLPVSENYDLPSYSLTVNNLLTENVYTFPEEDEVRDICQSIQVAKSYRHSLDRHIFKAEVELARLRRMRDSAQSYIDDHKATISLFRRLPTEIITEILQFSLTVPASNKRFFERTGVLFEIPESLWKLGHVCRRWRSIISTAMPTRWTKLTICLPHIHPHAPSILSDCLLRSKNFPLSVKIITREVDGFSDELDELDDTNQTSRAAFIESVKLLIKEAHRWKSFTLHDMLSCGGSGTPDWPSLLAPVKGALPLLEDVDLALKSFESDAFVETPLITLNLNDRAQLYQGFLTKFNFSRLTKLTICLPWTEMPLLTQLPKLVNLTLHTRQWESPVEAGLIDPIQLPGLRRFTVDCGHMSRVFSLPALEVITADFYNEWGRTTFAQFIRHLPTKGLKQVTLHTSDSWVPRPSELVPFSESAEDVHSLNFSVSHQKAEIVLALLTFARHANGEPKQFFTPFRRLQHLKLRIRVAPFSSASKQDAVQAMGKVVEMLLRMIKTRSRAAELPCGPVLPLQSLKLEFSCRWKEFGLPKDLEDQIRLAGSVGLQLVVVRSSARAW
ncbi:hypothetical protein Moror_13501 [Moniliophthora roreri MCA 2997]|uniref:Uncharacterized protein n=1 Tax=Moniliophthora roreri (strain MCA 2997) TaxID=1381753 RepID=V2XWQ5_MONRO|nr:hypothetical protein Moror_13501 [Moniliophthora roreri MCA 2997]